MSTVPGLHWSRSDDPRLKLLVPRLSDAEERRARRISDDRTRQRFEAGCRLARVAVAEATGVDADLVAISRRCPSCRDEHGRPRVVLAGRDAGMRPRGVRAHEGDVDVSVSHTGSWVVVAVGIGTRVGVDIEEDARALEPGEVADLVLHPAEMRATSGPTRASLIRAWVRKEAVLKATGDGLRLAPSGIQIEDGPPPIVVSWRDRPEVVGHVSLRDLDAPAGLVGALAVLSPECSSRMDHDGTSALSDEV